MFDEKTNVNLSAFNEIKDIKYDYGFLSPDYDAYSFYPYLITMNDLSIHSFLFQIKDKNTINIDAGNLCNLKAQYIYLNYLTHDSKIGLDDIIDATSRVSECEKKQTAIKVESDTFNKIKIAVANTLVPESYFEKVLKDMPDRSYKRYKQLVTTVNEAIRNHSNLFILPECYLPFEWLPIFSRTCAKNQMAVVVGLEHLSLRD